MVVFLLLEIARGNYISIIDQDDFVELDYVFYLYNLIKKYDAEISLVPHCIAYKNDKDFIREKNPNKLDEVWSGEYASCQMLYTNVDIGPWNKMIKKKLLEDNQITFNEELFGGEGYCFSIDSFMHANKIAVGYKGIYHYRIDNYESEMSKFRLRTAESSFKAIEILLKKYQYESKTLDKALNFASWNVYCYFLKALAMSGEIEKYKDNYQEWKSKIRKNFPVLLCAPTNIKEKIKMILLCISPKLTCKILKISKKGREYN